MTLVQLANFLRIAELRSLSKAAAVVRIAQPALTRQVRQLEAELGSPLLVRHAWGVALTPAGEILVAHARRVLREADATRDAVQAASEDPSGRVGLGVPTSLATTLVPALEAALRVKHPRLRPYFVDGFSAVLHARTVAGNLDMAVLYEDRAIGPLATAPLLAEALTLVGPPGEKVSETTTAEMLATRRLIVPARPNRLRLIVDEALAQRAGAGPEMVEVDSLPATIAMAAQGAGFAILPFSAVSEDVALGRVAVWDLRFPQLSRTLLLARPQGRQVTVAMAAVELTIRELVRDMASALRWRPLDLE